MEINRLNLIRPIQNNVMDCKIMKVDLTHLIHENLGAAVAQEVHQSEGLSGQTYPRQ